MIQKIIHNIFERRHFWRDATFSEIAELYSSRLLRIVAQNIAGAFASVYLYNHGMSVANIALMWVVFYALKAVLAYPVGILVAWIGPKHATLVSTAFAVPSMISISLVPIYGFGAIVLWGIFTAFSSMIYNFSYILDFSKIRNVDHGGKEIGFMNIVEKVAGGISPLVGGFIALVAGPEAAMVVSAGLYFLSAAPLFHTREPVLTRQRLLLRGFPWRLTVRSLRGEFASGFDSFTVVTAWVLFVAINVIGVGTNNTYAVIGILNSVSLVVALATSYIFGKMIDGKHGLTLLKSGVFIQSLVHFLRPFVPSPLGAAFINAGSEVGTTGQNMAFMKGMFDVADRSEHRVAYVMFVEMASNVGACFAALILYFLVTFFGGESAIGWEFIVAGFVVMLIAASRFPLYRK